MFENTNYYEIENFLYFLQDNHLIKIKDLSRLEDKIDEWENIEPCN